MVGSIADVDIQGGVYGVWIFHCAHEMFLNQSHSFNEEFSITFNENRLLKFTGQGDMTASFKAKASTVWASKAKGEVSALSYTNSTYNDL